MGGSRRERNRRHKNPSWEGKHPKGIIPKQRQNNPAPDENRNAPAPARATVSLMLDTTFIPNLDGNLTTWEAFRDTFEYFVRKSPKLIPMVKLHQLRTHMRGMAFDTTRGHQLSGINYD